MVLLFKKYYFGGIKMENDILVYLKNLKRGPDYRWLVRLAGEISDMFFSARTESLFSKSGLPRNVIDKVEEFREKLTELGLECSLAPHNLYSEVIQPLAIHAIKKNI